MSNLHPFRNTAGTGVTEVTEVGTGHKGYEDIPSEGGRWSCFEAPLRQGQSLAAPLDHHSQPEGGPCCPGSPHHRECCLWSPC